MMFYPGRRFIFAARGFDAAKLKHLANGVAHQGDEVDRNAETVRTARITRSRRNQPGNATPPCYHWMVGRLEFLGLRIVGLLLVLLGITLFLSPRIAYTTHEKIRSTQYQVQRDKVILVRRPVAVAVAAGGIFIWILLARKTS